MSTYSSRSAAANVPAANRSIDDLDAAICTLARQMNAQTYRLLMLVREFDDRLGWAKWGLRNCAEWLAWRCGLSLSAAREKVRTAQALRAMPATSEAFADGRLSYSKVRALTRVAELARRGLAARVRAERDGAAGRGALPANSQRRTGVDAGCVACVGAALVHSLA